MHFLSIAVVAGACLIGGALTFVNSSPMCEVLCGAGALLAAGSIVLFLAEAARHDDPYREGAGPRD
jgi:hypothetical protein